MPSKRLSRRALLSGVAAGTTIGLAGCSTVLGTRTGEPLPDATAGSNDWPASGYDARNTRYNADAAPPRSKPTPRWSREFRYCTKPFVRDNRVVTVANGVAGLRTADGEQVWQSTSEPWGFQPPTLGAQRAYVTGPDCAFGVDLETGEETWHPEVCHGSNTASGTIANGRLYLEYGGYFSALDATGRIRWATAADAQGSPAVEDDVAYVATVFTATAVDLTARAIEWPWEDPDDDAPAYASREAATIWSVPPESRITGPRVHYSPALADETVYVVSEYPDYPGGELWALARGDGEELWSIASPPNSDIGEDPRDAPDPVGRPTAPVVTDDLVVVALGDRHVRALTLEGEFEWTTELDHELIDLAGAGNTLVATTHDRSVETTAPDHARLVAFDLDSGEQLWTMSFDDHVEGIAIADETIYTTVVTERDGNLDIIGMRLVALE